MGSGWTLARKRHIDWVVQPVADPLGGDGGDLSTHLDLSTAIFTPWLHYLLTWKCASMTEVWFPICAKLRIKMFTRLLFSGFFQRPTA